VGRGYNNPPRREYDDQEIKRPDQAGFLSDIIKNLKLTWRLLRDSRVPIWQKLIPPATLLYVISPIDFVPDAILGLGQLDDVSVVLLGIWGFIQLCPQDVVQEHLAEIMAQKQESESPPQVIDVDYEVVEDDEPERDYGAADERESSSKATG